MDLITPRMRFRWNQWKNRWFRTRESARESARGVFVEQKMCPSCRALVNRRDRQCPYCGQRLRVLGTGPAGRLLSRFLPQTAPVTSLLLLGNLLMFAVEMLLSHTGSLLQPVGNIAIVRLGLSLPMPIMLASGQYWRWVTAMFLHAGWMHIGFNMLALYYLGPTCESLYGPAKFLSIYLATGFIGNIVASAANTAVLGASGALFGLLGLMITYGWGRHDGMSRQVRSQGWSWTIFALLFTVAGPALGFGEISLAAHLGGLLSGAALGRLISDRPPLTAASVSLWRGIQLAAIVITLGSFFLMIRTPLT
jgi:rhomboid protease GluP